MKRLYKMAKVLALALSLLMLFACSDDSHSSSSDPTGSISVTVTPYSRDLETYDLEGTEGEYKVKTTDELYWTYTAVKTDGGLNTGETGSDNPQPLNTDEDGNAVMGLPGDTIGNFSYGLWTFQIDAYYYELDDDGNETGDPVDYYVGDPVENVAIRSSSNSISVNVRLVEAQDDDDEGILYLATVYGYSYEDTTRSNPFDLTEVDEYILHYVLDDEDIIDEDKEMASEDGLSLEVEAGYHTFYIYMVNVYDADTGYDDDIIAASYLEDPILVRTGITSTIYGYLQEGVTTGAMFEFINLESTDYTTDNEAYTETVQIYPGLYTASTVTSDYTDYEEDFYDLGTLSVAGTEVTVTVDDETETYTLDSDRSFSYTITQGSGTITYTVTLCSDTSYVYTTRKVEYTVAAASTDTSSLGTVTVTVTSDGTETASCEAGTDSAQTVEEGEFLYASGALTYNVTLDTDESYTYTTYIKYKTYTGDEIGTIVLDVTESTATVSLDSSTVSVTDYTLTYTDSVSYAQTSGGSVTYSVYLDDSSYTYEATVIGMTSYASSESVRDFGKISVDYTSAQLTVGSTSGSLQTDSDGNEYYDYTVTTSSGSDVTYRIVLEDGCYYTASMCSARYVAASDSTVTTLGTISIEDGAVSYIGTDTEPSATLSGSAVDYTYTVTGSINYDITLSTAENEEDNPYTYTAVIDTITYVQGSDAEALGSITLDWSESTATVGLDKDSSKTYTVSGDALEYTDTVSYTGQPTYSVELDNTYYTYTTTLISADYVEYGSSTGLGTITVKDGTAVIGSDTADASSSTFTYSLDAEKGYVSYTIELDESDYSYSAEGVKAKYIAEDSSGDITDAILVEDGYATVGSDTTSIEVSSNSFSYEIEKYSGYVMYIVSLDSSSFTYSLEADYITYTQNSDSLALGNIQVDGSDVTFVNGNGSDVSWTTSGSVFTCDYSGDSYYTVTLNSDYTYTATKTVVITYTDSNGSYGDIVKTTVTTASGSTISYNTGSSFTSNSSNGYGETLSWGTNDSSQLVIAVGYAEFAVSLTEPSDTTTSGSGTYTATTLHWLDALFGNYGEYRIKIYYSYKIAFLSSTGSITIYLGVKDDDVDICGEVIVDWEPTQSVDASGTKISDGDGYMTFTFSSLNSATLDIDISAASSTYSFSADFTLSTSLSPSTTYSSNQSGTITLGSFSSTGSLSLTYDSSDTTFRLNGGSATYDNTFN